MKRNTVAPLLGVIGILFFLAGAFDMLPSNTATFAGVAFMVLSGSAWALWPKEETKS